MIPFEVFSDDLSELGFVFLYNISHKATYTPLVMLRIFAASFCVEPRIISLSSSSSSSSSSRFLSIT